jgi:hemoglobin/transferrin/lactoferrin receptor protein
MRKFILLIASCYLTLCAYTQNKSDTAAKELEEVTVSFNKWEQKINEIPNKITKINRINVLRGNPQTAADLLSQSGTVFVQKSQLGGGSPMIRGFATNRILLVFDGVRMNNAIYRSGNLQNIISIDPLSVETAEVIFGPGSLIYGSDAIGGVMDFHSFTPRLSNTDKLLVKGSVLARYSSANQENTVHADINIAGKKWSLISSASFSDFEDLRMGKNGGQDSYLKREYIQHLGAVDSVFSNPDPRVQRSSGYQQLNYLGKLRFKASAVLDLQYTFNYAGTSDAARYDRLIQYRNGRLRFAEWNYGPMLWRLHSIQAVHKGKNKLYDEARFLVAYQNYEESRIDRARANNNRNRQQENVNAISVNWDAFKKLEKAELFFGIEHVYNKVGSTGITTNIATNLSKGFVSRYPDGSSWSTTGAYLSYKLNFHPKLSFTSGLRYSYNTLNARFDTTYIKFPYQHAELKEGALTGSAGLVFRPEEGWLLSANLSTGYRMPNVDDIGKLFESAPGNVTIPNPNLESEYAGNMELGISKSISNKLKVELSGFHTILDNAIVRRPSTFNGQDSIPFDNVLSRVEALQNVAKATVWGLQVSAEYYFIPALSLQLHANWITGRETDDTKNEQVALRHAPPFYGTGFLRYKHKNLFLEFSVNYNSAINNKDLAPSEQAKTDIYAKDDNGKPYSPSWNTINLKATYQLTSNVLVTAGWENMTNQRYRPYSSGIVAAGSNFIGSVRVGF